MKDRSRWRDLLDRLSDTSHPFLEVFLSCGIGKPDMAFVPMSSEIDAWRQRDACARQQVQRKPTAVLGEAVTVGVDVKRTIGRFGYVETERTQRRQQVVTPLLEYPPSTLELNPDTGIECGKRCVLRRRVRGDKQVLRQFLDRRHIRRRRHE